jgi:hypothetical protein
MAPIRVILFRGVLPALLLWATAARAADLDYIAALVKGGATQLALKVLDASQKSNLPALEWSRLEQQRFAVLRALRRWDELTRRVDKLPENVPIEFRREALEEAAQARLATNDAEGARRYLRRLLWNTRAEGDTAAHARRLIIRTYVQEGRLGDAQVALLRYQQDYQAKSEPWQVLRAEILLQADNPQAAFSALTGLQSYEAKLLRLTAALRSKQQRPNEVFAASRQLAGTLSSRADLRRAAWVLAAEAAGTGADDESRVLALEQALSVPANGEQPLFRADADDLWRAYDRLAERIGNSAKLLVGNDDVWLEKAESVPCTSHHIARAIYGFLSRRAFEPDVRSLAHRRLASGLMRDGRSQTLESLYTASELYPTAVDIPPSVRYALADKAIADYNIRLAADLIKGLDSPPEGEVPEDWSLRRARILVYAGDYRAAVGLLHGVLTAQSKLDLDLTGRFLQILFDLQAVDRHDDALALLQSVYDRSDSDKVRREILFWMADSHNTMKRYNAAAEHYLRSATFAGAAGEDPWGHTARFYAAEALGRAGLTDDARRVYRKLMQSTADPRRRAQIERQMQQLWLNEKPASTP